jgi:hypothetical protein
MYRTALTSLRPSIRSTFSPAATRAFSVSARTMAGGDTGASRPGGVAQGYVYIVSSTIVRFLKDDFSQFRQGLVASSSFSCMHIWH